MKTEEILNTLLDEIDCDNIYEHTDYICAHYPGRLPGTKDAKDCAIHYEERMKSYGLDTAIHKAKGYLNLPGKPVVNLLTPKEMPLRCKANAQCGSTPLEGITAELIYVGPGGMEHYEGKDAKGKIILTELSYEPPRSEKMRIGMMNGAVGMIIMNWGPDDCDYLGNGTAKSVWGNPTPETIHMMDDSLPVFSVTRKEGVRLRKLLEAGETIKIYMNYQAERSWMPIYLPSGTVHAKNNPSGDFVLVAGHMDSWEVGASDNGAGNATAMELARVLQKNRDKLVRDVRFVFWQGHEAGQMEGSTWYCDHFWDDLNKNCVMYINIDGIGLEGASVLHSEPAMELSTWVKGLNEMTLPVIEKDYCFPVKTADMSMFGIGVPSCYSWMYHTPEERKAWNNAILGLPYHSEEDTIEHIDKEVMKQGARADAAVIFDMAMREVLPQNFTVTAKEILKRIEEMQKMVAHQPEAIEELELDKAANMAKEFLKKAEALEAFRSNVKKNGENIVLLNGILKKISRVVMPMLCTVYGKFEQDNYGLTGLKYVIPNSTSVMEVSGYEEGSHEFYLWLNRARKERNKITDALLQAMELCDLVLIK